MTPAKLRTPPWDFNNLHPGWPSEQEAEANMVAAVNRGDRAAEELYFQKLAAPSKFMSAPLAIEPSQG